MVENYRLQDLPPDLQMTLRVFQIVFFFTGLAFSLLSDLTALDRSIFSSNGGTMYETIINTVVAGAVVLVLGQIIFHRDQHQEQEDQKDVLSSIWTVLIQRTNNIPYYQRLLQSIFSIIYICYIIIWYRIDYLMGSILGVITFFAIILLVVVISPLFLHLSVERMISIQNIIYLGLGIVILFFPAVLHNFFTMLVFLPLVLYPPVLHYRLDQTEIIHNLPVNRSRFLGDDEPLPTNLYDYILMIVLILPQLTAIVSPLILLQDDLLIEGVDPGRLTWNIFTFYIISMVIGLLSMLYFERKDLKNLIRKFRYIGLLCVCSTILLYIFGDVYDVIDEIFKEVNIYYSGIFLLLQLPTSLFTASEVQLLIKLR